MKKNKKHLINASILVMIFATLFIYSGCSKDDEDETPAATCSDGIQNQGESGVDCGGPCSACPTSVCTGNGSTDYFPMALNNYYTFHETGFPDYTDTIVGTQVFNSKTYNKFKRPDRFNFDPPTYKYYRKDTNGDIYEYNNSAGVEYLLIPANPVVNQSWAVGTNTRKVISLNASSSTASCAYTGLLQIDENFQSGNLYHSTYYKPGVGRVVKSFGIGSETLYILHLN